MSAAAANSVGVSGTIQLFIYVNDTEATIGDAFIDQMVGDPNALGPGQGITFQNSGQSVSVESTTTYMNVSDTGVFDFNLSPKELLAGLPESGQLGRLQPHRRRRGQRRLRRVDLRLRDGQHDDRPDR